MKYLIILLALVLASCGGESQYDDSDAIILKTGDCLNYEVLIANDELGQDYLVYVCDYNQHSI